MVTEGYMMETQYVSTWEHRRTDVLMYPVITTGGVMYLKDRSPYLDSSFLCSESQNTIKINLLGTYSTVNTPLRCIYLHYLA